MEKYGHVYVSYYIFDMTPYEPFLLVKNGTVNLKMLTFVYDTFIF